MAPRLQVDLVGLGDWLGLHAGRVEFSFDVDHVVHLLGHDGVVRVVVGVFSRRQAVPRPLQRAGSLQVRGVRVSVTTATSHLVANEESDEHGENDGDDDSDS